MPEIILRAPAKINLGLEVLRRRSDGFHDINTLFATVGLYDELRLRSRSDAIIRCTVEGNPGLESGRDNLCVRAAELLRDAIGERSLGLDIHLRKTIPIGAGLGGGSSDAASVLIGGSRLWEKGDPSPDIMMLATTLGSDVPFFLHGGVAHAVSRGEVLWPLSIALPWSVLLINPGIHIPTPWAYRMIGREGERSPSDLIALLDAGLGNPGSLQERVVNDFEPAIFAEYPLLQRIKERLYERGALLALMSGSGSTMFGLFGSDADAAEAASTFPTYWSAVTRFIPGG